MNMNDELSSSGLLPRRHRAWWQLPSVLSLVTVLLLLGAALGWSLWRGQAAAPPAGTPDALPWQVSATADGSSQVFGLTLGRSTLADVQARFPDDLNVGLIAPNGQPASLEAFVDTFRAGFVTGKLVLAFEAEAGWLQRARERSPRNEVGEGGRSRRYRLADDDGDQARAARVVALALLPSARLDEAMVIQRFGAPTERHTGPAGEVQLLYPVLGVAIALPPTEGDAVSAKAVIQYVPPRDFEARLRGPLLAAQAASASAH